MVFVNWRMRWILFLTILFSYRIVKASVRRAWIGDTTYVKTVNHDGDTNYLPKVFVSQLDTFIVYYDVDLIMKAQWSFRGNQTFFDTCWFRNGTLKSWTDFHSDPACYNRREWYPDGSLKQRSDCTGDTNVSISYYNSGSTKMKIVAYRDSNNLFLTDHYIAEYYENGQLIFDIADPSAPVQIRRKYYSNGQKMWEITLRYHFAYGPFTEWYANGQIRCKGTYSEIRRGNSDVKDGKWSYYNESGKLVKEEFYEEGKLVKTVEY